MEDKLQDEVPETINALGEAGIKVRILFEPDMEHFQMFTVV